MADPRSLWAVEPLVSVLFEVCLSTSKVTGLFRIWREPPPTVALIRSSPAWMFTMRVASGATRGLVVVGPEGRNPGRLPKQGRFRGLRGLLYPRCATHAKDRLPRWSLTAPYWNGSSRTSSGPPSSCRYRRANPGLFSSSHTSTIRATVFRADNNVRRSSASDVRSTTSLSRPLDSPTATATEASITSRVPVRPHNCPADRAARPSSGISSHRLRARDNRVWRPPSRQTWPITPAGTRIRSPFANAVCSRDSRSRLPRSMAMSAPASRTMVIPRTG